MKEVVTVRSIPKDDPYVTALFKNMPDDRHVMIVRKGETIFSQGDQADSVYFIQSGSVEISIVSYAGKEGVLAIMGPHSFFGEECLAASDGSRSSRSVRSCRSVYGVFY
jgi:CRP-like cAMP-binding protein